MSEQVRKGDQFVWDEVVHCTVLRVAKDGSWADLRCRSASNNGWNKRQPLPLADGFRRVESS